jgi:hypothetical protein
MCPYDEYVGWVFACVPPGWDRFESCVVWSYQNLTPSHPGDCRHFDWTECQFTTTHASCPACLVHIQAVFVEARYTEPYHTQFQLKIEFCWLQTPEYTDRSVFNDSDPEKLLPT